MALTIWANTLTMRRYLQVRETEVVFLERAIGGGGRRFPFAQVDCLLLSRQNLLSFQVGREVFSLPTSPQNAEHQGAIQAFLMGVRRSAGLPARPGMAQGGSAAKSGPAGLLGGPQGCNLPPAGT